MPPFLGNVFASNPKTFDSSKQLAHRLIDHGVRTPTTTTTLAILELSNTADKKRKFWVIKKDKAVQNSTKEKHVIGVHAMITPTTTAAMKQYAGSLPNCNKCNIHHNGPYREMQCSNCNRKGHT